MRSKQLWVDRNFDEVMEQEFKTIKKQLELLGMPTRKLSKRKVTKLMAEKYKDKVEFGVL